jgi:RNA polymerase sigma-70 factor (ECF subfamily)
MLHAQAEPAGRTADAMSAAPALPAAERDEALLLGRVAAGELRAFEELYRAYHPRLASFLGRVVRRPTIVEEVLNDTMLVVWRRADAYNGECKVSTWIFAIAYRKALKALQRLDEPVDDELLESQADSGPGPEAQVNIWQLREALRKALDELPAGQRAVVNLTYFHGMGYSEIARIVSCPVGTVKTRMFHARRRLRALLAVHLKDWR